MIIEEYPVLMGKRKKNKGLIKHYSDNGMYILQVETNTEYEEAIDLYPCKYTYEETNKPIENKEEEINE